MVLSMERWKGKVAVVTGTSSGIGAAIAEQLVEEGLKVVGLARRKEKLEELAKKLEGKSGQFYGFPADITKEDDILKAFQWVKDNVGPVHILINNAGIGRVSDLIDGNTEHWRVVLDTNVMGLCIATREAIKDMRANNVDGHIIHMNSILGHKGCNIPKANIYSATKFAVTALTETLRQELNTIGSKIKVTSVSPGLVATNIIEASYTGSGLPEAPKEVREMFSVKPFLQPKDIAEAVTYVLSTAPHVQVNELIIKPVGEMD